MKGKIGIRPVNDGRDSVRYKIEGKAFSMAEAAKKLIESNIFYLDGTPVECVIAKHTITCAAEAADVDEEFAKQGITATLTVTPIFCFGTETIDMNPHSEPRDYGKVIAATVVAIACPLVLFAFFQKKIVEGISVSGLK